MEKNSHERTYYAAPTFVQFMSLINQLIFVCVSATPTLKKLTNMQVKEGQKLTLRCELLAGGSKTKIQWYHNGKKIVKNDTRNIKRKKKWAPVFLLHITFLSVLWSRCASRNG